MAHGYTGAVSFAFIKQTSSQVLKSEIIQLATYPSMLIERPKSKEEVGKIIEQLFPRKDKIAESSRVGNVLFCTPYGSMPPSGHPPHQCVIRLDHIPSKRQALQLYQKFERLFQLKPAICIASKKERPDPGLHLGIWTVFKCFPIVTWDTRHQSRGVKCTILGFMLSI